MNISFFSIAISFIYSEWKWKIFQAFNLNISFIHFNLQYSGEACLQERILINSRHNITIGRYCGRRYQWSVFVTFHTFDSSQSWFELQYELTDINITSYKLNYKNCNAFTIIENNSFVFPFGWINKYLIKIDSYYNWNIFVPKMYQLSLMLMKYCNRKNVLYLYDGPDYLSDQYDLTNMTLFTSTSFQISVLLHGYHSDIEINFNNFLSKEAIQNYKVYSVKNNLEIISTDLKCGKNSVILCAFNFIVNRNQYVNITLSFKYFGPNIGYCMYGGLSIYDYINSTIKEVLLLCDNLFSLPLSLQPNRNLISNTESLFLVFYSYILYSDIEVHLQKEPSSCQGVIIER